MKISFHTDNGQGNAQQWNWLLSADVGTDEHEFFISMLAGDFSRISLCPKNKNKVSGIFIYKCNSGNKIELKYEQVAPDTYKLFSPY